VTSLLRGIAGRVRRALLAPTRFRAR
jgi:hypothetical protein